MFFMLKLLRLSKFRQLLKIVSPYADHIQNRHKLSIFKSALIKTYQNQSCTSLDKFYFSYFSSKSVLYLHGFSTKQRN